MGIIDKLIEGISKATMENKIDEVGNIITRAENIIKSKLENLGLKYKNVENNELAKLAKASLAEHDEVKAMLDKISKKMREVIEILRKKARKDPDSISQTNIDNAIKWELELALLRNKL